MGVKKDMRQHFKKLWWDINEIAEFGGDKYRYPMWCLWRLRFRLRAMNGTL